MKTSIHIVLCWFYSVVFYACGSDCPEIKTEYYPLRPVDIAAIKYTGTDTLNFSTRNGDTITFYGGGWNRFVTAVLTGGSPDCNDTERQYEGYSSTFQSTDSLYVMIFTYNSRGQLNIEIFKRKGYTTKFNVSIGDILDPYEGSTYIVNNTTFPDVIRRFGINWEKDTLFYSKSSGVIYTNIFNGFSLIK